MTLRDVSSEDDKQSLTQFEKDRFSVKMKSDCMSDKSY